MALQTDRIQEIDREYSSLTQRKQATVLTEAFNNVKGCLPETKAVYEYITTQCKNGMNEFSIPAMLVPAMLGLSYTSPMDAKNFVSRTLKKKGEEGKDWVTLRKNDFDFNCFMDDHIEFKVPGRENESIVISKNAGNAAKWYFITPAFARLLLFNTTQPVGRQLSQFYLAVHDSVLRLKEEIEQGRIALVRIDDELQALSADADRAENRLLSAHATLEAMGSAHSAVSSERNDMIVEKIGDNTRYLSNIVGALYPIINGRINRALTGKTRGEFARTRKLKPIGRVNYTEYFDEELFHTRLVILKKLNRKIQEQGITRHNDILALLDTILVFYVRMRDTIGHGNVMDDRMPRKRAMEVISRQYYLTTKRRKLLRRLN